ncbi:MAG: DsbE family thiol:disulfide interchange protein [Alphaproteobacteria bacterium]|nr:DsbE family thiol:disulfide interchange protein [Alphaproteobacteria bacterium]
MNRAVFLIPLVVFFTLAAFFAERLVALRHGDAPNLLPSMLINKPVPAFALSPMPGHGGSLSSADIKGQVTLVNFFGSWCVACAAEHPFLVGIKKSGIVPIFGVDWRDDPVKGAEWLSRHGDPYTKIGLDPDSKVAIDFGVTGAPETFVIDAAGVIRYKQTGPITAEVWESTLLPLIKELRK